ncbi:MAG: hypothetical protein M3Z20_20615 [Chloroflexota bacterium]|nr:hypothetical protein [Chloroflexota bacterium]
MTPDRALDAYLDALISGAPVQPHALDHATIVTVARLFAADDVPGLTPEVEDQIWREVLRDIDAAPPQASRPLRAVEPLHASVEAETPARQRSWQPGVRFRMAPLATAVLVLLLLLGSLVVIHSPALPRPEEPITISVGEAGRSLATLATTRVAAWPALEQLLRVTLRRETFAPGAVEEFGLPETTGSALDLMIVETGVLTMEADGALTVWRGGGDLPQPVTIGAGTLVQLHAGDQVLSPSGVAVRRSNAAAEPAVIISVLMTQNELLTFPPGVTNVRLVPDLILNRPWPAPAALSLRRAQLQPGAMFPLQELPGLQMLYVEEGTLDLMGAWRRGDLAPVRWDSVPTGQGAAFFESTSALANSSDTPTTFLVVTVETDG